MANLWGYLLALFIVAHAVASVAVSAIPAGESLPFNARESWLLKSLGVTEGTQGTVSTVLVGLAALALVIGALGMAGVPGLVSIWNWLVVVGAGVSLVLLTLYFNIWLSLGVAIDLALLVGLLVFRWPTNAVLGIS